LRALRELVESVIRVARARQDKKERSGKGASEGKGFRRVGLFHFVWGLEDGILQKRNKKSTGINS